MATFDVGDTCSLEQDTNGLVLSLENPSAFHMPDSGVKGTSPQCQDE